VLAALAAPVLAAGAGADPLPAAAKRLHDAVTGVRGLRVEFHQIRDVELTGEEIEADGFIAFRPPGDFRMAYRTPEVQEVVVSGDSLWVLMPSENQALRFSFEPGAPGSEIFLLFGGGARELDEVFVIVQEPWADYEDALLLTPRADDGTYPIQDIRVVVGDDGYPRRLFYREVTGDSVVFDFRPAERNPENIGDLVRLVLTPGMEVHDGDELQGSR
jgi:outer membrane lipoprotein-sorting protein